ncbi:hypothetical protein AB1N83_011154 [Pleurotus pulmonarius]
MTRTSAHELEHIPLPSRDQLKPTSVNIVQRRAYTCHVRFQSCRLRRRSGEGSFAVFLETSRSLGNFASSPCVLAVRPSEALRMIEFNGNKISAATVSAPKDKARIQAVLHAALKAEIEPREYLLLDILARGEDHSVV